MAILGGAALGGADLGEFFGIGQQGEYYKPGDLYGKQQKLFDESAQQGAQELSAMRDPNLARQMAQYSQGEQSLGDMLQQAGTGEHAAGRLQEFATGPLTAGRFAQEQVGQGPLTGRLFGAGDESLMSQNLADLQAQQQGLYDYKPEEAVEYGQVAGDIARRTGQQEQSLANIMSQRGIGNSGVAGAQFSGLAGNKYEQLGKAQSDLRQRTLGQRMANLGQLRNFQSQLNQQQQGAIGQQLGSQFQGRAASEGARAQRMGEQQASAGLEAQRQMGQQELQQQSLASKLAGQTPGLGEAFGRGLTSSAQSFGAAPGTAVSSAAGSAGSAATGPKPPGVA